MRTLLAAVVTIATIATSAAAAPPTAEELARDLASPVYAKREAASQALWKLGDKVRPVLEAVVKGEDAEARDRAQAILEKFDWGLAPDTPARIAELLGKVRGGTGDEQIEAVRLLLHEGLAGAKAVQVVLQRNLPEDRRANLTYRVATSNLRLVPEALVRGDAALAEQLLLAGSLGADARATLAYEEHVARQGRIAPALKELKVIAEKGGPAALAAMQAQVLLFHRSHQNEECRKILDARFKHDIENTLYENILEEQGDWTTLADLGLRGRQYDAATGIGINLTRERLAGRTAKADALWKELKEHKLPATATIVFAYRTAAAWSMNGRPVAAMEHFKAMSAAQPILIDMMAGRMQFDELLALEPATPQTNPRLTARTQANVNLRRGRTLALFGKPAEADAEFDTAFSRMADDRYVVRDLLRAEVRGGHWDKAAEHTVAFIEWEERRSRDRDSYYGGSFRPSPFEILFEDDADAAQALWTALKIGGAKGDAAMLRRIRDLLRGRAGAEAASDAVAKLESLVRDLRNAGTTDIWGWITAGRGLAAVHSAHGRPDLAEAALRRALAMVVPNADGIGDMHDTPKAWVYNTDETYRLWIDLGDLMLQQGRPASAAEIYLQGWKHYPNNPVPLYHSGRALLLAGDSKEGERRIAVSHEVAGADANLRGRYLDELLHRGRRQDLQRERDRLRAVLWRQESSVGNVWALLVRVDGMLGDHAAAARDAERYGNYVLTSNGVSFVDGKSYLDYPAMIPLHKAVAAAKAGRVAEALMHADGVLAILPGHAALAAMLVPELDAAGAKTEADKLFNTIWKVHRGVVEKHPGSGWACTSAANVAAAGRRELDAALHDAERGVALEPQSIWAREVLAEVHFRRGDRAAATGVMTKLAADAPRNHFYQRQLKRFAAGDVASPSPVGPME